MTLDTLFRILGIQRSLFLSLSGRDDLVRQSPRHPHLYIGQCHPCELRPQRGKHARVTAILRLCLRIDHADTLVVLRSHLTEGRSRPQTEIGPNSGRSVDQGGGSKEGDRLVQRNLLHV